MKLLVIWCFILAPILFHQSQLTAREIVSAENDKEEPFFGLLSIEYTPDTCFEGNPDSNSYNLLAILNQALKSIKASSNFIRISQNHTLKPVVSCHQISWGIYTFFFEDAIRGIIGNRKPEFGNGADEHLKEMPQFSRLAAESTGKILISFSGVYDRIFFAEMVLLSNTGDCRTTRPVLNEVYVYMFHIKENDQVSLIQVKRLD